MPHFAPTEEQEEIRKLAASLATQELRKHGREAEKQGDIPSEVLHTLTETGLTTPFDEQFDGSGRIEATSYALIAEELAFGDGGQAANIIGSLLAPVAVDQAGNQSQKQQYLPAFGDASSGQSHRGSFAYAERTGGYTLNEIQASLTPTDGGYTLNGSKRNVIHGEQADLRVVLARIEGTEGVSGICAVVLPNDANGFSFQTTQEPLGLQAAPSATCIFEETFIPKEALLGPPGCADVIRIAALHSILRAGIAIGTARAALEYAHDYAAGRYAFGRPIASYQGIAFIIAEMAMKLDAARLLTWRAASLWDKNYPEIHVLEEAEAAQRQALKIAQSATTDAVQVLGGAGFIQDHPTEMWMRNAAAME
jgi:alkylation response protein AidB-like acyl-CoA dehydrogenase